MAHGITVVLSMSLNEKLNHFICSSYSNLPNNKDTFLSPGLVAVTLEGRWREDARIHGQPDHVAIPCCISIDSVSPLKKHV